MVAITADSDFGAQEEEILHYFHLFPCYLPCSNEAGCRDLSFVFVFVFYTFGLKPAILLHPPPSPSSFTLIKRLFSSSSLSAIRVVSSTYLRLLMFLPPILIPGFNSSNPAFLMICSAYRLNRQGDSRQPCPYSFLSPEPISCSKQSSSFASWPAYGFLRRQEDGLVFPSL